MDWKEFILALLTLIFGTGWLWTWKSYRRKNEGEATQSEAEGWAKQQMVYQKMNEKNTKKSSSKNESHDNK